LRTQADSRDFAERWVSEWNRKDVEAVLSHFSDDVVFASPRIQAILGVSPVEGKTKLREYWTRAIGRVQTIHFALDHVIRERESVWELSTLQKLMAGGCVRSSFSSLATMD